MTAEFPFMFWTRAEPFLDDDTFDACRDAVIHWCEERFGPGAVSTPTVSWLALHPMGSSGVAVSNAWIMTGGGDVAFQHVDHAFEFKFRWC